MRGAWFRFGACVVAMSCSHATSTTLDNHDSSRDFAGAYWCSIAESDFTYKPFPCAIRKAGERLVLVKLAGTERFEGVIAPAGAGFTFSGRFYCAVGDCDQALHGEF